MAKWNPKCRFFNEKYACDTLTSEGYKSCDECKFASEYSKKILILKFGALGDVLRTTPILEALKKKYGDEAVIYWMTAPESEELLKGNPYVDKVLVYNAENLMRIQQEKFDVLFSLEIDTPVTLLANVVDAKEKYGFYFDNGATSCFNKGAEEYLETAFLTHVKKMNRRTYQEMIFHAAELEWGEEEILFELDWKDKEYSEKFKKEKKISGKPLLGINFSAGSRWPSKGWSLENVKELVAKISGKYQVILLGGRSEKELIEKLLFELKQYGVLSNNTENSVREFAGVLNLCDKVIVTDSMALHLATSLDKDTIALFFSTPGWEIFNYGRLTKLQSPLLEKHFFSMKWSEELANSISADEVIRTL